MSFRNLHEKWENILNAKYFLFRGHASSFIAILDAWNMSPFPLLDARETIFPYFEIFNSKWNSTILILFSILLSLPFSAEYVNSLSGDLPPQSVQRLM